MRWAGLLAAVAALATACADESEPADPGAFSAIDQEVLRPSCTYACHSGGELYAAGGLDLDIDPLGSLVGIAPTSVFCSGNPMMRVTAGDPESSLLYVKIVAKDADEDPPCGEVMPPGSDREPIAAADVERIRAWIAAGAPAD